MEVDYVSALPMFKLDRILLSEEGCILMIIVQVVMDLRRVEFADIAQGLPSDWPLVFAWETTLIVTEVVSIVLLSILLQLGQSLIGI